MERKLETAATAATVATGYGVQGLGLGWVSIGNWEKGLQGLFIILGGHI